MIKLEQLKKWYNHYKDFWPQWKNYKYNGLDSRDAQHIEMLRDNGFKINTVMLENFHTQDEIHERLVTPLIERLEANYPEYKEWVSMMFELSIVKYAIALGIDLFCKQPISSLPIDDSAKEVLLKFNCNTIGEMLAQYNSDDYVKKPLFKNVLRSKNFIINAPNKELFVLEEVLTAKQKS